MKYFEDGSLRARAAPGGGMGGVGAIESQDQVRPQAGRV
jgi:hypothetical protein